MNKTLNVLDHIIIQSSFLIQLKVIPQAIIAGIKAIRLPSCKNDDELDIIPSVALQAACAAVAVMEDDAAFNAGYGSMPNEECNVEMDAAVMDGKNRSYGSVAVLGFSNDKKIFSYIFFRIIVLGH